MPKKEDDASSGGVSKRSSRTSLGTSSGSSISSLSKINLNTNKLSSSPAITQYFKKNNKDKEENMDESHDSTSDSEVISKQHSTAFRSRVNSTEKIVTASQNENSARKVVKNILNKDHWVPKMPKINVDVNLKDAKKVVRNILAKEDWAESEREEGREVLFSGTLDFQRKGTCPDENIVWTFSLLSALKGVPVSFVASSSTSMHAVIVTTNGSVYTWGRGTNGQLGIGSNPAQVTVPVLVEKRPWDKIDNGSKVTAAATGANHTLLLISNGDIYGFGANTNGQLGLGKKAEVVSSPQRMLSKKYLLPCLVAETFLS